MSALYHESAGRLGGGRRGRRGRRTEYCWLSGPVADTPRVADVGALRRPLVAFVRRGVSAGSQV